MCLGHMMDLHVNQKDGRIEDAFVAYNKQRLVRTARIQMGSRMLGQYIFHPDGAQADVRNAYMRGMSAEDYYNELQWLYGASGLTATA